MKPHIRSKLKRNNYEWIEKGLKIKDNNNNIPTDSKCWYQVVEQASGMEVCCLKWTNTMLLGTAHSAAVIIKGKGLFELVECCFSSQFQALYDSFVDEACNFVQVGRYHRFWVSTSGSLRVIVVTPQIPSNHPEWNELFLPNRTDLLNMRLLGRRIGYFINDISKEGTDNNNFTYRKSSNKKDSKRNLSQSFTNGSDTMDSSSSLSSRVLSGLFERYCGFHLYCCWSCKKNHY